MIRSARQLMWPCLLLGACSTPTQILVTVDGAPGFTDVSVEVDGIERARTTLPLDDGRDLPLTLTLLHGGGELGPLSVGAVGRGQGGAVVARTCQRASFTRGGSVSVQLALVPGSVVPCDPGTPDGGALPDGGTCDPVACAAADESAVCMDGRCVVLACTGNMADCDPGVFGCETNTRTSAAHCGGCFRPCDPGQQCRAGSCS